MKRFFIIAGIVILSFLLGYGIVFLEKRQVEQSAEATQQQLQAELADSRAKLQVASVTNQLGVILIEVDRNNFGNAKELSTRFFDNLTDLSRSVPDPGMRDRLSQVLSRRDEIITDLAMLKPEVSAKLQGIYVEMASLAPAE
jgi:hypothetical protein